MISYQETSYHWAGEIVPHIDHIVKFCFNELRMIVNYIINFIFDKTIDNLGCLNEI